MEHTSALGERDLGLVDCPVAKSRADHIIETRARVYLLRELPSFVEHYTIEALGKVSVDATPSEAVQQVLQYVRRELEALQIQEAKDLEVLEAADAAAKRKRTVW